MWWVWHCLNPSFRAPCKGVAWEGGGLNTKVNRGRTIDKHVKKWACSMQDLLSSSQERPKWSACQPSLPSLNKYSWLSVSTSQTIYVPADMQAHHTKSINIWKCDFDFTMKTVLTSISKLHKITYRSDFICSWSFAYISRTAQKKLKIQTKCLYFYEQNVVDNSNVLFWFFFNLS